MPESDCPSKAEAVLVSARGAASPYMIMKMTKKMAQAQDSYQSTARSPMKLKIRPRIATIMTPRTSETLPSETAESARPPVMLPTEDHPNCSTTLRAAMILDGHQPKL